MKLIDRPNYLKRLLAVKGTPDIKVITGVRRSGKSKLLEAFADTIFKTDPHANIIRINFNLMEFEPLMEYHALYRYVDERRIDDVENIVIIDEIQMCESFERAINSLHATEKYDLYITGSNAFLMSSDLATLFTGRTFQIEVFPFSLNEFARYHELSQPDEALDRYLREGGMPGSYLYSDEKARFSYISDILDMLILRDIKQKHRIRNAEQLARSSDFLLENAGNIVSLRSIVAGLSAAGLKMSEKTLANYVEYLCSAFLLYRVRRYDIAGKKYLSSGDKYYLVDHSFRYAKLGTKKLDFGHVYENMVAIELIRRGFEIYVGTLYKKEVDFVAVKRDKKVYIQVSDDISQESTFEREIAPLLKIRDAYPKVIIARTKHETTDWDGVAIVDIARWLMGLENCF